MDYINVGKLFWKCLIRLEIWLIYLRKGSYPNSCELQASLEESFCSNCKVLSFWFPFSEVCFDLSSICPNLLRRCQRNILSRKCLKNHSIHRDVSDRWTISGLNWCCKCRQMKRQCPVKHKTFRIFSLSG